MTKPRVRIDKHGWVRNDQPFPFVEDANIRAALIWGGAMMASVWMQGKYLKHSNATHWRFA